MHCGFWLLLPGMCSLLDVVYETSTFFKLPEVMMSFSWIIDEILVFLESFSYFLNHLLFEVVLPLILIRRHNLQEGNYIKVHHFENRKWLKIANFGYNGYFRVICVFFEPLLLWARITPQINQKTLIIVLVSLRSTLSNAKSFVEL